MTPQRTPDGKWVLYDRATGQRMERWSIDARDLLDSGAYTTDAPDGAEAESSSGSVVPPVQQPHEYAPGVPLVITRSIDAPPAQPVVLPTGRRGKR